MGKDKEKSQALKNPSVREKIKEVVDPAVELAKRICYLESYIEELTEERAHIERQWRKNYVHICFFFLIIGCIIGFIAGAILL